MTTLAPPHMVAADEWPEYTRWDADAAAWVPMTPGEIWYALCEPEPRGVPCACASWRVRTNCRRCVDSILLG